MDIGGVNSNSEEIKTVEEGFDNSKMSRDEFLKVLLAEIQWQDPLNVKSTDDFINNAIKLREMEAYDTLESSVENLANLSSYNTLLSSTSLIGKNVKYEGDITYVRDGKGYLEFELKSEADSVTVYIFDDKDNKVEQSTFKNLKSGEVYPVEIENDNLQDGYYRVVIEAYQNDTKVDSIVRSVIPVERVERTGDNVKFVSGNVDIETNKIIGVEG